MAPCRRISREMPIEPPHQLRTLNAHRVQVNLLTAHQQRILRNPKLESVRHTGYRMALNHRGALPVAPRAGGHFKLNIPQELHAQCWREIAMYTKLAVLGTMASTPTRERNQEFHAQIYIPDQTTIPIFIHTKNAADLGDRLRIVNNLAHLGFEVNDNDGDVQGDYTTSRETDEQRAALADLVV